MSSEKNINNEPTLVDNSKAFEQKQQDNNVLIKVVIVLVSLFFLCATFYQFFQIKIFIQAQPLLTDLGVSNVESHESQPDPQQQLIREKMQTLALLEAHIVNRRYQQASIIMMTRLWISYMGFLTGMILSFVGATFILGKVKEDNVNLETKNPLTTLSLNSTSPGLVLVILGVFLMTTTLLTKQWVKVEDSAVYISDDIVGSTFVNMSGYDTDVGLTPLNQD